LGKRDRKADRNGNLVHTGLYPLRSAVFLGGNCSSVVKNWLQMAGIAAVGFSWQILVAARFLRWFDFCLSFSVEFLNFQQI